MVLAELFLCDQLMAALYNHCSLLTTRKLSSRWASSFFSPPTLRHTSVYCVDKHAQESWWQDFKQQRLRLCVTVTIHTWLRKGPHPVCNLLQLCDFPRMSDPYHHHHYRMLAASVMSLCHTVTFPIFIWKHLSVSLVPGIFMSWSSDMACGLSLVPMVDGCI